MAKRRRSNRSSPSTVDVVRRDVIVRPRLRTALRLIEDHRLWSPEGQFAAPLSFPNRRKSRLVVRNANFNSKRKSKTLPAQLGFSRPDNVIRCVRRKIRKEVMVAFRRSGRGTKKRFNYWSDIHC